MYSDTIIKAISELHRIELSIFSLWKQLPNLDIDDSEEQYYESAVEYVNIDNIPLKIRKYIRPVSICQCPYGEKAHYGCVNCLKGFCGPSSRFYNDDQESVKCPSCGTVVHTLPFEPSGLEFKPENMPEAVRCSQCNRWFKDDTMIQIHQCSNS